MGRAAIETASITRSRLNRFGRGLVPLAVYQSVAEGRSRGLGAVARRTAVPRCGQPVAEAGRVIDGLGAAAGFKLYPPFENAHSKAGFLGRRDWRSSGLDPFEVKALLVLRVDPPR